MHCACVTVVAAGTAIGDVRLQIGLVGERAVTVGIDAARVGRAGWSDRTIALHRSTRAGLGARPAGARRTHGRRWRNVALARGIGRRLTAGAVDGAVAIVVDAITGFGARIDRSDADDGTILALFGAEGTRIDIRCAARARCIGRVVVDDAVAIVVDAIARFGARIDGPNAHQHTVLTLLHAIFAGPDVGLSALRPNASGVVVDHAIAIVIDAITRFWLGIDSPDTHQTTGLALVCPVRTGARIGRSALPAHSSRRIVNDSIAIVVLTIAGFGLRIDGPDANQVARLALNRSEAARKRIVRTARNACPLRLIVHCAVTVVVNPVTRFHGRIGSSDARHLPILALDRSERAGCRSTLSALRAFAADIVVDGAIAIVIDGIACLRLRVAGSHALQRSRDALDHAHHAGRRIRLTTRDTASLRRIVDHAIAIVIDAVADFHARIDITHTHDLGGLALRHAECTWSNVARSARSATIRGRVIDRAIAIIVQTITRFEVLILDDEVGANANDCTTLAFGRSCMDGRGTFPVRIAITNRTDVHVHRQVIGRIDFAIAIVIETVANLDAIVRDVALILASRGVGIVEVPKTITRGRAIALQNLALRIRFRARHRPIVDTLRCPVDRHASPTASTAIRRARTQIHVLVLDPIAIVILVIA